MRRALLALAVAAGLAIGTVVPVSALGETSITLNCSDGTSVPLLVDTDTLNSLTASVQAMTLYPAGLSCSIIQNPLGTALFGHVALAASPGQNPFVVGGGRWQAPFLCETGTHPLDRGEVAKVPGSWSYEPIIGSPTLAQLTQVWVNIAVNVHQANDLSFFGTLNETIPAQTTADNCVVNESHFTSTPTCLVTSTGTAFPRSAAVTAVVSHQTGAAFPNASPTTSIIHFSFSDSGMSPSQQTTDNDRDHLLGPPALDDSSSCTTLGTLTLFPLANGNISVRNPPTP